MTQSKNGRSTYKYCFIPYCSNTTTSAPGKDFICVPRNELKRKAWCEAVGCPEKKLTPTSYCCEDHFDLQEDVQNYKYYKAMGGRKILKENVIPRFFNPSVGPLADNESETSESHSRNEPSEQESSSTSHEHCTQLVNLRRQSKYTQAEPTTQNQCTQTIGPVTENKYIQARPTTRSVGILSKPFTQSVGTSCMLSSSPTKALEKLRINDNAKSEDIFNSSKDSVNTSILDSSFSPHPCSSYTTSSYNTDEKTCRKKLLQDSVFSSYTKIVIEDNPLLFIGVSRDSMYCIDLLQKATNISLKDIYLTLKKIRLNLSNKVLSYEFGLSESQVSRIFRKTVPTIATYLKQLIFWPAKKDILLNLPIQFRYRYNEVQSIIDCFEIQIDKPSDAINQSITWSDYKKCNTAKYLISITPDGLINFISEGFSGRATDMAIVENSGYLDLIPSNVSVLADRGFKQLDTILHQKNCKLIRPPSVMKDTKSTKQEVKLTKQIASIRIHVERVIKRIRDFQFLESHASVNNNMLDCLDNVVIIAAALLNLQSEIIKQS